MSRMIISAPTHSTMSAIQRERSAAAVCGLSTGGFAISGIRLLGNRLSEELTLANRPMQDHLGADDSVTMLTGGWPSGQGSFGYRTAPASETKRAPRGAGAA